MVDVQIDKIPSDKESKLSYLNVELGKINFDIQLLQNIRDKYLQKIQMIEENVNVCDDTFCINKAEFKCDKCNG